MAQDINKHLDRARKSLEKNKLREAVSEYQAVLEEAPAHQEALQALADIHTRLNEPALAAEYYGIQFDRLVESGDGAKARAAYQDFLALWKDADPDVPILKEAKAEYAKLQ